MPFSHYHSARIIEPNFSKYTYKRLGNGVDLVLGIKDGKTHTQAIRFNVKNFTTEEAKTWLRNHNKKYKSFHPAKSIKEEESASSTVTTTTGDIATFANKVGPMLSRQSLVQKKKTIREMLEYIINDTTSNG